jgi:two-component system NtrC family response regulator
MKPKILAVDDEGNMLLLLTRVLSKEGYQVISADSSSEGLKRLREQTFQLAILDQQMPEMNGIEFLWKLREIDRDLPVILITAFPSWEKEQQAKTLGCLDYLQKPLNLKLLKDIVKKIIKKN